MGCDDVRKYYPTPKFLSVYRKQIVNSDMRDVQSPSLLSWSCTLWPQTPTTPKKLPRMVTIQGNSIAENLSAKLAEIANGWNQIRGTEKPVGIKSI